MSSSTNRTTHPPRRRATHLALLATGAVLSGSLLASGWSGPPAQAAAAPGYSVETLHFKVEVGPASDRHTCDVVGDLYRPTTASPTSRVPAILTSNGFGGSKDDQAGLGRMAASRGYAVLSYSGLGFGGSGCKIYLDHPVYDGQAGSQLVSYLGGADGMAYRDQQHNQPAPRLRIVRRDAVSHDGTRRANDPRVGMVGGSYGGGNQFATASVDPRVDTLVPLITWNDLSYSLGPNGTDQLAGPARVSTRTPGATKLVWGLAFSGIGLAQGLATTPQDPSRAYGCPNFADFVCPALATAGSTGYFQPQHVAKFRESSVGTWPGRIRVPTLLIQGQVDTLFNLNESLATYRQLRAQGTPVKLIWQHWGHSGGTVPGELDMAAPDPRTQYITGRVMRWFAHYLKGSSVGTGPRFAYFREWIGYLGNAAPAYRSAADPAVGTPTTWRLGARKNLTRNKRPARGSQSFTTVPAGAPASSGPLDVLPYPDVPFVQRPVDAPGTFAQWTTARLRHRKDVVGIPVLRLKVSSPTAAVTQASGPGGMLVVFAKVEDVARDGSVRMIHGLETPVRVPDVTKPFTVRLPGIVHRFRAGHRIRLVVAGSSPNYRGGLTANPVQITSGSGQTITLHVVR